MRIDNSRIGLPRIVRPARLCVARDKMWTVYTPFGDYTDIPARSAAGAKWKVFRLTLGKVEVSRMTAVFVRRDFSATTNRSRT